MSLNVPAVESYSQCLVTQGLPALHLDAPLALFEAGPLY